jgi:hypothetical protein
LLLKLFLSILVHLGLCLMELFNFSDLKWYSA